MRTPWGLRGIGAKGANALEIVLAAVAFDHPGGMQSYLLTVAPHLERLGHELTIYSPQTGPVADLARERGLRVVGHEHELPEACDAVLSSDAVSAWTMAELYPSATRGIVVHGGEFDLHLPPGNEGVVAFAVAMNGVVLRRLGALAHPPEVARLRQPIDIAHFCAAVPARERAERVLLLGNYLSGSRRDTLVGICEQAGVACRQVGATGDTVLDPFSAILEADIVVGQGRAALEGMACGRAVWVYGPSGADGWVTEQTYPALEDDGFRARARAQHERVDPREFAGALEEYRPQMGEVNRELTVLHHSPYDHAVALVGLFQRDQATPPPVAPLREMARLVRTHHDAQARVGEVLHELREVHHRYQSLVDEHGRLSQELASSRERVARLEDERRRLSKGMQELVATRRWRAASAAARPLEWVRRSLRVR